MITKITTILLACALDIVVWPMCRAGQSAVLAQSDIVASFWERVGATGETLEIMVDHLAARLGVRDDILARVMG